MKTKKEDKSEDMEKKTKPTKENSSLFSKAVDRIRKKREQREGEKYGKLKPIKKGRKVSTISFQGYGKRTHPSTRAGKAASKSLEEDEKEKIPKTPHVRDGRGIVIVSHIPPDFREKDIHDYFKQFGVITSFLLPRSKKSGRSMGHVYIEYKYEDVAKVVAETMNNYMLFNRLLKAKFTPIVPPFCYQRFWERYKFDEHTCPRRINVRRQIRNANKWSDPCQDQNILNFRLRKLYRSLRNLQHAGINYRYKPAIVSNFQTSCSQGKYVLLQDVKEKREEEMNNSALLDEQVPVLEIDESDKEIEFTVPPNVIKRKLASSNNSNVSSHPALPGECMPKKIKTELRKGQKRKSQLRVKALKKKASQVMKKKPLTASQEQSAIKKGKILKRDQRSSKRRSPQTPRILNLDVSKMKNRLKMANETGVGQRKTVNTQV